MEELDLYQAEIYVFISWAVFFSTSWITVPEVTPFQSISILIDFLWDSCMFPGTDVTCRLFLLPHCEVETSAQSLPAM
jgi:hypothetical protein